MIVVLVVLLILLTGVMGFLVARLLDDDGTAGSTSTTAATAVVGGAPAPGTPDTEPAPGPGTGGGAPCDGDALLTGMGGSVQGTPVMITDFQCTSATPGYAWARVVPADPTVVTDPLTVYLADVDGVWQSRNFGTGITCTGSGIPTEACAELP
jgi:hypothetical protein